jgi:aspartyl-tRNA(Asn)/glutamyl-tRNA(Gln) amidotransferase subunit B
MIDEKVDMTELKVKPGHLAEMIGLIENGAISGKIAKEVLLEMFRSGNRPALVVEEKGLLQISDASELEAIAEAIIEANPGPAEEFRSGKDKVFGFFVGQMMKATKGKANPAVVNEILKKKLQP